MNKKTRFAKSFYDDRHITQPVAEYWPESTRELRGLLMDSPERDTPRLILGDGQHVRDEVLSRKNFEVIRTEKCNEIINLDVESTLVRVEAGMRWRDLQQALEERNMSMQRYRLYPSTATIGGLLARRHAVQKALFYGDLRDGCVALSAVSPGKELQKNYRYIPAPRKSSGPDLRHLYLGAEGSLGCILDASLVTWHPVQGHLYRWIIKDSQALVLHAQKLFASGIRPAWSWYQQKKGEFVVALVAPGTLLQSTDQILRTTFDGEPPEEVGDLEELNKMRRRLEDRHPDRRSSPSSSQTVALTMSMKNLAEATDMLVPLAERIEIHDWTAHNAVVYATLEKSQKSFKATKTFKTLRESALDVRFLIGSEKRTSNSWTDTMKQELDSTSLLAANQ